MTQLIIARATHQTYASEIEQLRRRALRQVSWAHVCAKALVNPVITLLLSLHWVTVATESIAEDLTNLQFYFRTFNDQSLRSVDVSKALTAAGSQARYLTMESERSTPITRVVP